MRRPWRSLALLAGVVAAALSATATAQQATHGTVQVNPLSVQIRDIRGQLEAGSGIQVRADIANPGSMDLGDVTARLEASPALKIRPSEQQDLRVLRGGTSTTATWQVCSNSSGAFIILVSAEAITLEGTTFGLESRAVLLDIGAGRKDCPRSFS